MLRDIEDHDVAPAISHFLNCLFGSYQAPGGKLSGSMQSRAPKRVCPVWLDYAKLSSTVLL